MSILRIATGEEADEILLEVLDPSRVVHHGFGTFFEDIDPKDVEITPAALKGLLAQPERGGFQGLEFWPNRMLAWANLCPVFVVGLSDVNMPEEAKTWVREMTVVL